jgi:hypothetical protein
MRRATVGAAACLLSCALATMGATAAAAQEPVTLGWLGGAAPAGAAGVSWGVPFARGAVRKGSAFTLTGADGRALLLQSWPLAYWPDGSLKWVGFATVAGPGAGTELRLAPGRGGGAVAGPTVRVTESADEYLVDTGPLQAHIPRRGSDLIASLVRDGRVVARAGRLVAIEQHQPDGDALRTPAREAYASEIGKVTVEQSGPVRAVVRIQGKHRQEGGAREWLPFDVRFYFHAGQEPVRMVYTVIYDGDQERDFIRGLGLEFAVPMREEPLNRHVRFGGEGEGAAAGVWAEPIQPLYGRGFLTFPGRNVYRDQVAGVRVPNRAEYSARGQKLVDDWAVWSDYRLEQGSPDGFTIEKRTSPRSAWIKATAGRRAGGTAWVGDVGGGLGVGVKDFWQSYPAALEVLGAATDTARLRVWLWSPRAPAMDLRPYDTVGHDLLSSYEDWQPGFSDPHGVARTRELVLFPTAAVPTPAQSQEAMRLSAAPPLLTATPAYYHGMKAFGIWSLPDRSTPGRTWIEDQLDRAVDFYEKEVEQRRWYGFWDFGDVMHSYDPTRHTWRYDIGGFAWDNTELATDDWLWYTYLRTGRADVFRMAEAMTRHTSEVDVYHLGRFAGLGSRHAVRHWGDGSKEAREGQAVLRRFYYYLTTDERTGDVMRESLVADSTLGHLDPLRIAYPVTPEHPNPYPTRVRFGPDWLSLVGNWMTEWERTGDDRWRDRILTGVRDIAKMPYGPFSGWAGAFGFDPKTAHLYYLGGEFQESTHLSTIMGGGEMAFELTDLLRNPAWDRIWLQYASLYAAPKEEVKAALGIEKEDPGDDGSSYARLNAWAYHRTGDSKFAERAWKQLLGSGRAASRTAAMFASSTVPVPEVLRPLNEIPFVSTNTTAQWSLNAIELLELAGDRMPEHSELWEK